MDQDQKPTSTLAQILLRRGEVGEGVLQEALLRAAKEDRLLCEILVEEGIVGEDQIAIALGETLGFPYLALGAVQVDPTVVGMISKNFALRNGILPLERVEDILVVAMADPSDEVVVKSLQESSGLTVQRFLSTVSDIQTKLAFYYGVRAHRRRTSSVPSAAGGVDRRIHPRLAAPYTVRLKGEDERVLVAEGQNISAGGLCCRVPKPFHEVGSKVSAEFELKAGWTTHKFQCPGEVVWIRKVSQNQDSKDVCFMMGVEFLKIENSVVSSINQYVCNSGFKEVLLRNG